MATKWGLNPVTTFIFGFVAGIFFSSFVSVLPLVSFLIIVVGFAVLVDRKREVLLVSLILISFGLGSLRYAVKDFHQIQIPSTTGVVVGEPEDKENVRQFVYRADNGEKVLVSAPLYTPVEYGDRVEVKGSFKAPGMIEDFNYGAYLAKDDVYHIVSFAEVEVLSKGEGNQVKALLFRIKNSVIAHAKAILAEPYASLLLGLIVAGRDALPAGILEEFRRAGVIHIVVLSGFNITLIAEFLRKSLQSLFVWVKFTRFPQAPAALSILGIILFTLMTGASATVVRASVMAMIVIAAKLFGRGYSAPRALVFAAFLMLIENPKILIFDPSFQLSFLATLGLIYFMEPIEKKLAWVTERLDVRQNLAQTLATQLTVLPLLIYSVGDVSLVSIPANLLILVAVPYTMLVGFIAIILSYISTIIAWPIAYITHLMLSWILFVSHVLGSLPFATLAVPGVSVWVIGIVYVCLFFLMMYFKGQKTGGVTHEFASKNNTGP